MTPFRFLHTSDLHLGKPFGNFAAEARAVLQQARQSLAERLAACATENDVRHILVAGDSFDVEAPSERVLRQALTAMATPPDLHWWIIPGNHDSLRAELIWQTFAQHAPDNVHVLKTPEPVEIEPGVILLPAPCSHRFPGLDMTDWMDECATPSGALRIGLAHGGVVDFDSGEGDAQTISPRRAETARLDYLALGDWHGGLRVNARTHYSGTPERDRFKHSGLGSCLLVKLPSSGAEPDVVEIAVGALNWQALDLKLTPEMDAVAAVRALLPKGRADWRKTLVRLKTEGWVKLADRLALAKAVAEMSPEFCHFEWIETGLQTEISPADLDEIARSGALRLAAESLQTQASDSSLARRDRDVASAALNRLYGLVQGTKI